MKPKKGKVKAVQKFRGYYLADCECQYCIHRAHRKHRCTLKSYCCEEEKNDAIAKGRIKRKRGSTRWDS